VAYIPLRGQLYTYLPGEASTSADASASEDVTAQIRSADADPSIAAVVLEVDSLGGSPVAGEDVANALRGAGKPTVALIRDSGDSAAYLAASGAQKIFASAFSDVGDIGVTSSFVDQSKKNAAEGYTYHQLSVGTFKDLFDPDKPMTAAEEALVKQQLNLYYEKLIDEIAANRHLSVETLKTLSDGRSFTGTQALENKLIDDIGGIDDVREYLRGVLGYDPLICGIDG
jgi:protease-4